MKNDVVSPAANVEKRVFHIKFKSLQNCTTTKNLPVSLC